MPGTILDIKVAVGDTVKSGQAICVLEAMKMENDVNAPCDGKVLSVNTTKGSAVETGAVLENISGYVGSGSWNFYIREFWAVRERIQTDRHLRTVDRIGKYDSL